MRRAFLLGEGRSDRKQWIEDRLEELAQIFSISVAGFSTEKGASVTAKLLTYRGRLEAR